MNYCKDCRWYAEPYGSACYHPSVMTDDPVMGPQFSHPFAERKADGKCGVDGRLWEGVTLTQRALPVMWLLIWIGIGLAALMLLFR